MEKNVKDTIRNSNYSLFLRLCMQRLLTIAMVEDVIYQEDFIVEHCDCPDDTVGRIAPQASLLFMAYYSADWLMRHGRLDEAHKECVGMLYTADGFLEDLFIIKDHDGNYMDLTDEQDELLEDMYIRAIQEDMYVGLNVVVHYDEFEMRMMYKCKEGTSCNMYDEAFIDGFQRSALEILGVTL